MDLISISTYPVGTKTTVLVSIDQCVDDHLMGTEIPFGTPIAFPNLGEIGEGLMTLYNVKRSDEKLHDAWILTPDPGYPPKRHRPSVPEDLGFFHDVCCGLGGFSTALDFLHTAGGVPGQVVSAVDVCPLAMSAFGLNHSAFPISGDITLSDTVYQMHVQQASAGVQPILAGGFPCQPLSCQGFQKRHMDDRSRVLPALLRAAFWLQVSGVVLECVPEAQHDIGTQTVLAEFARLMGFVIYQQVLHLQHVWPSRRSRWFACLLPALPGFQPAPLPILSPAPTVGCGLPGMTKTRNS